MEVRQKDTDTLPIRDKGRVTIPVDVREELDLEEGDEIEIAYLGKV